MFDFINDKKKPQKKEFFTLKAPINKFLKKNPRIKRNRWISASKAYDYTVYDFVHGYFIGYEDPLSLDDILNMSIGTTIHNVIQENLLKIGALEPESVEKRYRDDKYGFAGAIDGVVQSGALIPASKKVPDEPMHLELKSCTEFAYGSLVFPSDLPIYYRCQAEIYQSMMGLDKTLFCFISRATHSIKCMVYEHDGTLLKEAQRKSEQIWDCIGRRELPHYDLMSRDDWKKAIEEVDVPLTPKEALENAENNT